LPNADLLELEGIDQTEKGIVLRVQSKETPRCPACSRSEVTYHSTYVRHLRDREHKNPGEAGRSRIAATLLMGGLSSPEKEARKRGSASPLLLQKFLRI